MNQKAKLTLEILDKLGGPLLAATADLSARETAQRKSKEDVPAAKEAETVAVLLARSVKLGLSLSQILRLQDTGDDADAARLALTGVAASLVAGWFRQTGKPPGEAEISRIVTAFEAVLAFSDNFSPAADTVLRLESLDPTVFLADENQILIQYAGVFVPVINAVAAYSFGRQEKALVQEIAGRVVETAGAVRETLISDNPDPTKARKLELQLLKSLVALYVESHRHEVLRLSSLGEKERSDLAQSGVSLDPVWQGFESRVAMLKVLGHHMAPDVPQNTGSAVPAPDVTAPPPLPPQAENAASSAPSSAPQEPQAPQQPAQNDVPPQAPPVTPAPDPTTAPASEGEPQENYNPMAFFKTKKEEDE